MVSRLPLPFEFESTDVLKRLVSARAALAELRGVAETIPNRDLLIDTLSLQEARESSAIENIITSHDDLYMSDYTTKNFTSAATKEVYNYATALRLGYQSVERDGLLTEKTILEVQSAIVENDAGLRALPGTELRNERTGEIAYTPPQNALEVKSLMRNLEEFINNNDLSKADPLIKMAIIHHQFESIHPFYDGNGRTGRIVNVLYLVKERLLDAPILYHSRFIHQNRADYYRLLQAVRDDQQWEEWILFMLDTVAHTSLQTTQLIRDIRASMQHHKHLIRSELPKIYSQDLLNNLFRHPYTKSEFVAVELGIHRNTARKYLDDLVGIGLLISHRMGRENFYINKELFDLLRRAGG